MKKPWTDLKSDEEAERFVEETDLSDYDFDAMVPAGFEFKPNPTNISMRVPEQPLDAVLE